ncbi:MAG TPA: hypothetical protein DCM71_11085 [Runella sp.]|nr:hypothetical protein [Runella sp.]
MKKNFFVFSLLLLALTLRLSAQTVTLSSGKSLYDLGLNLEILEDTSRKLTLKELIQDKHPFKKSDRIVPNLGVSTSAFWVRFSVIAPHKTPQWFLENYFRHVGKIDFYLVDSEGHVLETYLAGDWRGKNHRPLDTHNYVFPLHLKTGEKATVYLRIESITVKIFPFRIWEEKAFWSDAQFSSVLIGLYFGIIFILMVYFAVLYFYNRTNGYIFFSLFLFFFLLSELIRGNGSFFIRFYGVYHPFWSLHIVETYNTLLVLAAICNLYFYSESLKTRQTNPKLHRILMLGWLPHALLLPIIWARVLPMTFSLSAFFISPIGGYLVAGVVSVIRWKEGFTSAKYYLLGSLFFFCGLLITGLSYANLFSTNNLLFQNLLNLSSISEIVCLALGFADSIRVEREATINNLIAINKELQEKNEAIKASLLEGQILERKRVERELHDGLGAVLFGVRASLFGVQHEKLTDSQLKSYQNVEGLLLRAEREVRLIAHNQFPPELEEKGLVTALVKFVEDLNGLKVTTFQLHIDDFRAELNTKTQFELFSIVRELTANILKHARASEALIRLDASDKNILLTVQDNGLGFDASRKHKGLGMKNLSHRVETELRGQVVIDSEKSGTKISITVPIT